MEFSFFLRAYLNNTTVTYAIACLNPHAVRSDSEGVLLLYFRQRKRFHPLFNTVVIWRIRTLLVPIGL